MNNKHLSFGVFLLSVGVIWALVNFGFIEWTVFNSIITLWPLLIIMAGINIIFRDNELVKSLGWVIFLSVVVLYGQSYSVKIDKTSQLEGKRVVIERLAETKNAELKLDLGGVILDVDSNTSNLVDAVITDPNARYTANYKNGNETADIRFTKVKPLIIPQKEDYSISLNKDIVWDIIDLNVGAISGSLDLSQLKVKKVDLDAGAGKLEFIMGNLVDNTDVKIDAGASKIQFIVPADVGVRVKFDGGLNKTNLNDLGWQKQSGNVHLSPNYNASKTKINMDVDMGAGKFDIIQK
jgi:hypothetical protein